MFPKTYTVAFHDLIPIHHLDGIIVDEIYFKLDFNETQCNFRLEIFSRPEFIEAVRPHKRSIDIARTLKLDIDSYFYSEIHSGKMENYIYFRPTDMGEIAMTSRVFNIFFEELRSLSFNNYFGLFLSKRMKLLDTVEKMKTCCVCYEVTTRRTSCNHQLCIRCLMSLTHGQQKCPYCRQSFIIRQHEGVKIFSDLNQ